MNKYLSVKLKIISFLLMVMVVFIHSHNIGKTLLAGNTVIKNGYSSFIQDFISDGIALVAVPLFFAISGYLFFLKFGGTVTEFVSKYIKRLRTLVLPYLFWSVGVLVLFLVLQFLPEFKTYFGSKLIKDYSLYEFLDKIFITPIPLQFWFVKDLIILVFFSPAIYYLIKKLKLFFIIVLLLTWLFSFNYVIFSSVAILFFSFGAFLSINEYDILLINFSKRYWLYTSLWFTLVLCKATLLYINFNGNLILYLIHQLSILIGIVSIWSLYDFIVKDKDLSNSIFYSICSFSFFLYAFHIPALNIIKRALFNIMGKEEFASLTIYIIAPLLIIFISIVIGYQLKRFTPKLYAIMTGGR